MRIDIINSEFLDHKDISEYIQTQEKIHWHKTYQAKSYWFQTEDEVQFNDQDLSLLTDQLRDPVNEKIIGKELLLTNLDFDYLIEVSFKPGVTDNRAKAATELLAEIFPHKEIKLATGDLYFVKCDSSITLKDMNRLAEKYFGNNLIQRVRTFTKEQIGEQIPSPTFPQVCLSTEKARIINLAISDEELIELNSKSLWALNLDELNQIKEHFENSQIKACRVKASLPESPTDVEMEIIAQTWSEHCKHKIFNAQIDYTEAKDVRNPIGDFPVKSLFKDFIFKATFDVQNKFEIDWLISVFKDNAGIVRFDKNIDYCFKVETHNSPSALDPYGGALTGVLGVNRDILGCGIGALPVANTNILCFAPPRLNQKKIDALPPKLKHPLNILKGVHKGIEDGGNKSGIPTVNGSLHFHDNYAGKPLVYCGTIGVLPQTLNGEQTHKKNHIPGDLIIICGGSVGADGVHGATFSSLEMDDNAPATAVQIGDPFTQKRLTDFLIEARDLGLYSALTDNGAGGLSSSVGEMAEQTNGAKIHLESIPLKYPGLKPYEIVISESQERMTFAVPKDKSEKFMQLALSRKVNPAIIGEFDNSGFFTVMDEGEIVAQLDIDFLHNQLKPMQLKAHFEGSKPEVFWHKEKETLSSQSLEQKIHNLLAHDNIRSKEKLVRQFDHEVKAATIVKPFISDKYSSPSDAAVLWSQAYGGEQTGAVALGHGICPQYSHIDTYTMTQLAIDEAMRNVVASGADPSMVALCDNFCWPDPITSLKNPDGAHKLAQLVRSAKALYDTAMEYGTPFVSGKDSMKNDFIGKNPVGDEIKISVPPTLLISALAKLDHVEDFMSTNFKQAGDYVFYIGPDCFDQEYFSTLNPSSNLIPSINLKENKARFQLIHQLIKSKLISSCHDISEGGIAIALAESCFAFGLGFVFDEKASSHTQDINHLLFNEMSGGFIVSVNESSLINFQQLLKEKNHIFLGRTTDSSQFKYQDYFDLTIEQMFKTWSQYEY